MTNFFNIKRGFSNSRQWREFIRAVQDSVTYPCAVTYPMVLGALRAAASTSALQQAESYCSESAEGLPPA
jgi:hypothetical protein